MVFRGAAAVTLSAVLAAAGCQTARQEIAAGEMPWRSTPPLVVKPVTAELRKRYGQQINLHRHGSDAAEAAVRISYLYQPFTYPDGETRMLSGQVVWPYSNLMLHDMGAGLADPGDAEDAREWRTAPLWGLGIAERHLPQRGFLHDGRARTIEEAILWHGGEAEPAKQHFAALDKPDREALLEFVRSL